MKETVKTRPSREYGVLQHSAILWTRTHRGTQVDLPGYHFKKDQKKNVAIYLKSPLTVTDEAAAAVLPGKKEKQEPFS